MNNDAYASIRNSQDDAGLFILYRDFLKISGRDRASFLQGLVSADVLALAPGVGTRACMLNNTAHILADLVILALEDHLLIETDLGHGSFVASKLEQYRIREKVSIENVPQLRAILTLQGTNVDKLSLDKEYSHEPLAGDISGLCVRRNRIGFPNGRDFIVEATSVDQIRRILLQNPTVHELDAETFDMMRIEAMLPVWGRELTEAVIPLEAGLLNALSFTKGCYIGQEIIARIRSRGHINRSLRLLALPAAASPGDALLAPTGENVGRVTSTAVSPALGPIAMAYLRNEYSEAGTTVMVNGTAAQVITSPQFA